MKKRSGFTLIELLIVIGIIAILAGIVIIAVNPTKQFGQANDAQRQSDVNAILNAVSQYAAEHRGSLPSGMPAENNTGAILTNNGTDGTGSGFCNDLTPTYISTLPIDPKGADEGYEINNCSDYDTGYVIGLEADGRITVSAPEAEETDSISITR